MLANGASSSTSSLIGIAVGVPVAIVVLAVGAVIYSVSKENERRRAALEGRASCSSIQLDLDPLRWSAPNEANTQEASDRSKCASPFTTLAGPAAKRFFLGSSTPEMITI